MSKTGFWLYGAFGKLAGASLQKRADGRIIAREIVIPRNPRTDAQQTQRILMNTIMQAYSRTKDITSQSFEGVSRGLQSMAAFQSRNVHLLRQTMKAQLEQGDELDAVYAFAPFKSKTLAPNGYILSEGSLPGIDVAVEDVTDGITAEVRGLSLGTYRDIITTYQLCRGDQLTLVGIHGTTPQDTQLHYARVMLDPTCADGTQASLDVPFVSNGTVNLPSPYNEGRIAMLSYGNAALSFGFSQQTMLCAGIIVSRRVGNRLLHSCCRLTTAPTRINGVYYSMQDCLDLFKQSFFL